LSTSRRGLRSRKKKPAANRRRPQTTRPNQQARRLKANTQKHSKTLPPQGPKRQGRPLNQPAERSAKRTTKQTTSNLPRSPTKARKDRQGTTAPTRGRVGPTTTGRDRHERGTRERGGLEGSNGNPKTADQRPRRTAAQRQRTTTKRAAAPADRRKRRRQRPKQRETAYAREGSLIHRAAQQHCRSCHSGLQVPQQVQELVDARRRWPRCGSCTQRLSRQAVARRWPRAASLAACSRALATSAGAPSGPCRRRWWQCRA